MKRGSVLLAVLAACGDPATTALFEAPGTGSAEEFYDLPFPNDLRRYEDGRLDLSLFPTNALIVDQIRAAAESLDGFGLNTAIYARFDGPLDPASLPASGAGSIEPTASVYLVNVDADSAEYGQRMPIAVRFRPDGNQTMGINNLVARPYPGFPLDEGTTYALVITNRLRDTAGNAVAAAAQITQITGSGGDSFISRARDVYQALLDYLDEAGDDERGDLVSAAVFTTQRATFVAPGLRAAIFALAAPIATNVMPTTMTATHQVFTGNYMAPNFQFGDVPYRNAPSGEIKFDANGVGIVQRMESMRFALSVPAGPVPTNGWPIVIYAHGTGGSYASFLDENVSGTLAAEGLAVISYDQVLHGPRNPGGNPELDFFNFGNVFAARDNAVQGFADTWSQMRLALSLSIVDGALTHRFDASKVYFFGHSQGGVTGPGFIAYEPLLDGAILSGTAGLLYENLLHKTEPLDIPALVQTFIRDEPVDEDNPSLALVQMWIERSDSINYAPLMVRKPPTVDGTRIAPRNIFQTEGFTDLYSPNIGIEAMATAIGGDIVATPDQLEIAGLTIRGRAIMPAPISRNLNGATAVLGQYDQQPGSDGHFVVFDIPLARRQAAKFLGTLARSGQATVVQ